QYGVELHHESSASAGRIVRVEDVDVRIDGIDAEGPHIAQARTAECELSVAVRVHEVVAGNGRSERCLALFVHVADSRERVGDRDALGMSANASTLDGRTFWPDGELANRGIDVLKRIRIAVDREHRLADGYIRERI